MTTSPPCSIILPASVGYWQPQDWPFGHIFWMWCSSYLNAKALPDGKLLLLLKSHVTHYFVWEEATKSCVQHKASIALQFLWLADFGCYLLSLPPWVTASCSFQYLWHQAAVQDLLEWMPCPPLSFWTRPFNLSTCNLPSAMGISGSFLS